MKSLIIKSLAFALLLTAFSAQAVSRIGQDYIDRLVSGGPATVRDVAKSINQIGLDEEQVLDTLAERVWRDYSKDGATQIDATSWGLVALGNSGKSRYHSMINEIADTTSSSKIRRYANQALSKLNDASVPQYKPGTVKLTSAASSNTPKAKRATSTGGEVALSEIKAGMTLQEVERLSGSATSSHRYITGKGFNPFNVTGRDANRTVYYYKGQGRVVFSNQSAYTSTYRVLEVILDSNESGYP